MQTRKIRRFDGRHRISAVLLLSDGWTLHCDIDGKKQPEGGREDTRSAKGFEGVGEWRTNLQRGRWGRISKRRAGVA